MLSPLARGEWIEIPFPAKKTPHKIVSPRTRGVD